MADEKEKIILEHVGFSLIAGAIPFPGIDIVAATAVQMDMLAKLAKQYDVDFNEERGKSLISAILGSSFGSFLGRLGASLVKSVPGVGTVLGIGSQIIFTGASTYALGKIFEYHFQNEGNLFDLDVSGVQDEFKKFFAQGKNIAEEMRKKKSKTDIIDTIARLKELMDKGVISEEEFNKTKEELLKKIVE